MSFTYLSTNQLNENYSTLCQNELKKHRVKSVDSLPEHRKAHMIIIEKALEIGTNVGITGAMLYVKASIKNGEYTNTTKVPNMVYSYFFSPENSNIYSSLDAVMGISEKNVLDKESTLAALEAFKQLVLDNKSTFAFLGKLEKHKDLLEKEVKITKEDNYGSTISDSLNP
jgi:Substrate of the Dot/Icm secretion system, putative